jgi:hypothetical protein
VPGRRRPACSSSTDVEPSYALRLLEEHPERVGYLLKERVFDVATADVVDAGSESQLEAAPNAIFVTCTAGPRYSRAGIVDFPSARLRGSRLPY